ERGEDVRGIGPETRRLTAAVEKAVDLREDLDRDEVGALADAPDRQIGRRAVTGDDSRDVGAVPAALGFERARRRGAGADLLLRAVRAERRALRARRGRVACFLDDLAGEERMRRVDAAVDHRHHGAGAVVALSPGLVSPDQRDAVD